MEDYEYSAHDDEGYVVVYRFEDCIRALRKRDRDNCNTIKWLKEENRKLKEEYNKDEEIQKMQLKLNEMKEDLFRGFPITKNQEESIEKWKESHEETKHGLNTFEKRVKSGGAIGGSYSYHFIPTSIGTIGKVKCNRCGEEHEFCSL